MKMQKFIIDASSLERLYYTKYTTLSGHVDFEFIMIYLSSYINDGSDDFFNELAESLFSNEAYEYLIETNKGLMSTDQAVYNELYSSMEDFWTEIHKYLGRTIGGIAREFPPKTVTTTGKYFIMHYEIPDTYPA